MRQRNRAAWLGLVLWLGALATGGCDTGIDPDSLVRELRILGVRVSSGDPAAGPTAAELQAQLVPGAGGVDLAFTTSSVTLSTLVGAPTGPGRRLAAARPLQYDWFLCVGIRSLYSPGTVDPECRKWGPEDPDPKTNRSLVYLNPVGTPSADGSGALTVPTDLLKGTLLAFLQTVLAGSGQGGGTGGTGTMLPTRPLSILLPILLRVSAVGGSPADNRDSEVGYNYLRVVIAAPALGIQLPPPNHNPKIGPLLGSAEDSPQQQQLSPCLGSGAVCTPYAVPRSQGTFLKGQENVSIEIYDALDDSGRTGIIETLRFSWFSSDGDFSQLRTGILQPQTQWRNGDKYPAPPEVSTVNLWLVVQDERGGTDWQQYALQLQ